MSEQGTAGSNENQKPIDVVFEGGGVKGIGLVGAYHVLEEHGYRPENMAGASAGAIVAALVAAGYSADELYDIMSKLDFDQFRDKAWEDLIPLLPWTTSILKDQGIYEGKKFFDWIGERLDAKGKKTFGDLIRRPDIDDFRYRYKLQVIVSDVTKRRMLILPRDAEKLG